MSKNPKQITLKASLTIPKSTFDEISPYVYSTPKLKVNRMLREALRRWALEIRYKKEAGLWIGNPLKPEHFGLPPSNHRRWN